jgi:UDP-glucose 4-epimerase
MSQTILITGGAGYIGSHTILELLNAGYEVICVDNGCNAYVDPDKQFPESLRRVQELTGKKITFCKVDIRNREELDEVFRKVSFARSF